MAQTKSYGAICMLLVLTIFIQDFAECSSRGASQGVVYRKLFSCFEHEQLFLELKKMALKNGLPKLATNEMPEDWELRRVPTGPDPLHHNGQDPKKPRTP
ncbi:hypothetical protein PHJA_002897900 [Phtheirospermum japonicum]|uniref:Uncharacterized protein n=1 Tax=Phtheirospermum japonicum TaxID=374723 RepID=A0A830D4P8_9LAMI|nr:hypothetical protein PHJA_002897900 [Phtheirospermum japonicum]